MHIRNYTYVLMMQRFGKTTTIMKDRRAPRGGTRNEERELLEEYEESKDVAGEVDNFSEEV